MNSRAPLGADASRSRTSTLEHLFDVSSTGVYVGEIDPAHPDSSGTPILANASLKQTLGYPESTADTAVPFLAVDHYADAGARARLLQTLVDDKQVTDYLVQLRSLDRRPVWAEISAHVEITGTGSVRISALVRDVTERRHRRERARTLYQQLAHSEQLAAINRTLADVVHELRNPLSTIVAWAERLAQQTLDDRARKGISEILHASERAARIVRNAVQSSSRQPSTRRMVDLNELVQDTVLLRQHDQRAMNVTCDVELGCELPQVFVDAHQIQQVLLNLIMNAEQAMATAHDRGSLRIRTTADPARNVVTIEIADDGPGVPESVRSRIFDPFFTTKQAGGGTGLGLAVAQALTHDHGGSIRLEQRAEPGATFLIELPTRARTNALSR